MMNMMQAGGPKGCNYGCLGEGTCVKACPFDAIHIVNGVAVVDKEACKACGKCVAACPKHLIEIVPYDQKHLVQCSSKDKGKDVMSVCSVGCIGCKMCEKICKFDAVKVENNIAHIDPEKCIGCGACAAKCPKRRSFCRRTSFSEIYEIGIQENRMKRSFKTIISEGYEQFIKDIKQTKWAIIVIIAYFVFGRKFIYSICPLIMLTGYPCPSCGLTRAGIRLLHFDFAGAWHNASIYLCGCNSCISLLLEPLYQASVKAAKEYEDTCRNRTCGTCDFLYLPYGVLFPGEPPMSYYSGNLLHTYKNFLTNLFVQ